MIDRTEIPLTENIKIKRLQKGYTGANYGNKNNKIMFRTMKLDKRHKKSDMLKYFKEEAKFEKTFKLLILEKNQINL